MASTVDRKPAEQYVDFEEYVDYQLKKTRQQIRSADLLMAVTVAAVIVVGYLLAFVIADQWLLAGGLPTTWRWMGLLVWLAALGGWLLWRFGVPLMNSVTGLFAAQQVERAEPDLKSNLLNWVDLQRAGRPVDLAVLRAIERQAAVQLSQMDVSQAVDHRPLLRSGYALLTVMVLFCLYAVISPKKLSPSLWRVLPMADVPVPTRTEIRKVTPGDAEVLARTLLEVSVDLGGDIPKQVRLLYTTADQRFRDEPVLLQPDGEAGTRFRTVLPGESGQGLLRDLTYRIEAGDAVSPTYRVKVAQPPSARVEQIQIIPPEYTQLPPETIAGGQFTGWEGSRVTLQATVNLPVRSARLQFLDEPNGQPTGEEVAVRVQDGTSLSADWTLERREQGDYPHYYQLQCQTEDGRTDPSPVVYQYTILIDQPPRIVLLAPERDLTVPANAVIPLLAEASDPDFELGPVTLQIEKSGETLSREMLFPGKKQAVRIEHDLALKPLALKTGDEISFFLEAQDNRQPRRNRVQTTPLRIRIQPPTEDRQVQEQLAQEKARQREQIAELDRQNADRNQPPGDNAPPEGVPEAAREPQTPGDMPQDEPGKQPKPGEAASDDEAGQGGKSGTGSQQRAGNQNAQSGTESGENGSQPESFSPDGQNDQELLQKLLERFQQNGQKPAGDDDEKSPAASGQSEMDRSQQGDQPAAQQPNSADNGASAPQPGQSPPGTRQPTEGTPPAPQTDGNKPDHDQPPSGDASVPPKPGDSSGQRPPRGNEARSQQRAGSDQQPKTGDASQPGETAQKPSDPKGSGTSGRTDPIQKPPQPPGQTSGQATSDQSKPQPMPNAPDQDNASRPASAQKPPETGETPKGSGQPSGEKPPTPGQTPAGQGETNRPAENPGKPSEAGQKGTEPTEPQPANSSPMTKGQSPPAPDVPSNSGEKQPATQKTQSQDGAPKGTDPPPKGAGRRDGQRSDQPQNGEAGGSQQAQDGNFGSRQRGPGESTGRPGEQEAGPAQPREMQSSGQQQGGQQQGGQQQGGQQQGGQQAGGQQGTGQGGGGTPPAGQSTGQGGSGGSAQPGQRPGGGEQSNEVGKSGGSPNSAPPGDPANLEFKKQAAELVLQRLKDGLERGDVDPQLLEELGWTTDEMQRFVDRLSQALHGGEGDESPESRARRIQFEEMLRNLNLDRSGVRRSAANQPSREVDQIESRRAPVPGEYRKAWERYTRQLSKQPPQPAKAP